MITSSDVLVEQQQRLTDDVARRHGMTQSGNKMRPSTFVRILIAAICAYVLVSLISHTSVQDDDGTSGGGGATDGIPTMWRDMCQFLEYNVEGDEGEKKFPKYRLRVLAMTFRHGERSSLYAGSGDMGCAPYREQDRRAFEEYSRIVDSIDFDYFLKTDKAYDGYAKLPHKNRCEAGMMTAEGALQHLRLGSYMDNVYGGSKLFDPDYRLNVNISTSKYPRTFQSAVAFSAGFLFPHTVSLPQIYIAASNYTYLCMVPNCACDATPMWRHQYEKESEKYFNSRSPVELTEEAKKVDELSHFHGNIHDAFVIMDIAMGNYVCRRKPLPCRNNYCLSYDYLSKLLNETTHRGEVLFNETERSVARKLQVVEGYAILYQLSQMVTNAKKFPHTNTIKIFSGHDVTVAPLMRLLGVPFVDFPHYTSRVVFELYEKINSVSVKASLYMRVLYNGKDVTGDVLFCRNRLQDGLCSTAHLEEFLTNGIKKLLDGKTTMETCKGDSS